MERCNRHYQLQRTEILSFIKSLLSSRILSKVQVLQQLCRYDKG